MIAHNAGKGDSMASSLLALLDDIATVLDDVALMSKVAARKSAAMADDVVVLTKRSAQKTVGVLGDDLALNAQQVTGVAARREIPVVWAAAKGSLLNKAILVPVTLCVSAFAPWARWRRPSFGRRWRCWRAVASSPTALARCATRAPTGRARPAVSAGRWKCWPMPSSAH